MAGRQNCRRGDSTARERSCGVETAAQEEMTMCRHVRTPAACAAGWSGCRQLCELNRLLEEQNGLLVQMLDEMRRRRTGQ